jgi:peptidyl-dipeptidase Dcp
MTNPVLDDWTGPFALPPFAAIRPEHFPPAFEAALTQARAERDTIRGSLDAPSFANTVEAFERCGRKLGRTASLFFNLVGADSDDALEKIQGEIAPQLAKFSSETFSDPVLFDRFDSLWTRKAQLGLTPEQERVLFLTHRRFLRAGARLAPDDRARMGEIMQRLAALGVTFGQNVLADEKAWSMDLAEADLSGLPDFVRDAAAAAAQARGRQGWTVTLSRSLIEPFLTFSDRRDLREQAWRAWVGRGETRPETDNRPIVAETLALRAERARLLGYPSFADFKLDTEMAKKPAAVRDLLMRVWEPARARAAREADSLRGLIAEAGANHQLAAWDWRHYAEKLRERDFAFSEAELKPYLRLDAIIEAAFDVAHRLFGLDFAPLPDAPRYHPDVRVWEVTRGGAHVGVFYGDYFNRASKRSGAWCTSFRSQHRMDGGEAPVVLNVMNFAKAGEGPALLTWDDARTLFHEFGHALHCLLSDVTYPSIAGTSVARDFVELPSQLYEHWLGTTEVLAAHARNAAGEPMPAALIAKLRAAETFDQGRATVEYVGSALVDLAMHEAHAVPDPMAFEAQTLADIGMPPEVGMRHRTPHFQHVFSGDGYSAGYYSYMWSEVMDADAFAAFEETGDVFDAGVAQRLARHVLSAGGRQDAAEAYRAFRGRDPDPQAMLIKRGLAA